MNRNLLQQFDQFAETDNKMPVLFLGHGSPMNAIEENSFVKGFREIAATIEKPKAIVCISAHWETRGTKVTAMEFPKTIHDFGGFPKALHEVQYPAPGSPLLANELQQQLSNYHITPDYDWGLDHGAWAVIKQMYPEANIPVVQLSLDYTKDTFYHYQLGKDLQQLRKKGILIIGSGNIVHNLRMLAWDKLQDNYAHDWAREAHSTINQWIMEGNHKALLNYQKQGKAFQLAIPTPEHYLPLLYILALQTPTDTITLFNDQALAGSLTMTSVKIGS